MTSVFAPRRLALIGGVFMCTFGAGLFMQSLVPAGLDQKVPGVAVASVIPQVISDKAGDVGGFEVSRRGIEPNQGEIGGVKFEAAVLTSALPDAPQPGNLPDVPLRRVARADAPVSDLPKEEIAPTFACNVELKAEPSEAAHANVALHATCLPNAAFTLHHNGMMVSGVTDADGHWTGSVPALSQNALFIASFASGEGAAATAEISGLESIQRYVVQWVGATAVRIHAFEKTAGFGDGRYAIQNSPSSDQPSSAQTVMRLGDLSEGHNAEVFTFPTQEGAEKHVGLEFQVDQATCGRDFEAQAFAMHGTDRLQVRDLMIAMPDCDAVGELLVLKNPFEDLTIARN
ncbi:MAG: hypothetical protein AAF412_14950 [Pseudomonadota bacterium]